MNSLKLFGAALVAASSFCGLSAAKAQDVGYLPSPDAIKAHMTFLASDRLQGRLPGTPGFDIAADYVAARFMELGLKPAGDGGSYLQKVPLVSYRAVDQGSVILTGKDGKATPLVFGEDYYPSSMPLEAQTNVTAPLVFVGFGIVAPNHDRDDYRGLDVKGKIVVYLLGAPKGWETEERAHYNSTRNKRAQAAAHGAVGVIAVHTPTYERILPFSTVGRTWRSWGMTWRDENGAPYYAGRGYASVSLKGAAKLFAGAPKSVEQIMAAAEKADGNPPRFDLPSTATIALKTEITTIESENVAGIIEGSDPALKDEVVVLSAHLDHLGVGTPINGDAIYNGAVDNAAGVATTLEVARAFAQGPVKPRRSLLFLTVTAEEKGLIGSEYFAMHPTVPKASLVADVDLDMPMLSYDFSDVVAFGAERSTLGPIVRQAAAGMGVELTPDPIPDEGIFTRSDHYRFVEQGVPAVFLVTGYANGGQKASEAFLAERYHRPSDDMNQPLDFRIGAKFARLNYEITKATANADQRPVWNRGDFFGTLFNGPMAK